MGEIAKLPRIDKKSVDILSCLFTSFQILGMEILSRHSNILTS